MNIGATNDGTRARAVWRLLVLVLVTSVAAMGLTALTVPPASATTAPTGQIRVAQTFFAYVEAGETLDVSFVRSDLYVGDSTLPVSVTVAGPGGESDSCVMPVGSPLGTSCEFLGLTSAVSGVWQIGFDIETAGSPNTYAWEISVSEGGTEIPGRVWSKNYWAVQGADIAATDDFSLWYVGQAGHQYRADFIGFQGIDSQFRANSIGVSEIGTCTPAYESYDTLGPNADTDRLQFNSSCGPLYSIFFEPPAADLPTTALYPDGATRSVIPALANPTISALVFTPTSETSRAGTIAFTTANHYGNATIQIDADGNGSYDDDVDRVLTTGVTADGVQTVAFDGLDGLGDPIELTTQLTINVNIDQAGEIHFVNYDVERRQGLRVEAIVGPDPGSTDLYWNDTALDPEGRQCVTPVTDGRAGVDSSAGVHGWDCFSNVNDGVGGPWGDMRNIEDWTFQDIDVNEEIVVEPAVASYTVTKTADPESGTALEPGDVVEYTLEIAQVGNVAATGASLVDDLSDVLDDATWNDDLVASAGEAAFDPGTAELSWSGDLAVGDVVTLTYSVTVGDREALAAEGDYDLTNAVASEGCVGECTTTHPIGLYEVVKDSDPASGSAVTTDDVVTYTLTVSQIGQAGVAADLSDDLSDVLDDATWNGDLTADGGDVAFDAETAELSWSGDLAVGDVVTITYSVTVTGAGDEVLTNVVTSDGCVGECTTSHLVGTYSVVKTSDPASGTDVTTGDVITYTVTVTQAGPGAIAADLSDDLSDVLDDATWNGDLTADGGEAAFDAETGQLVWSGDLAVGDVVTITYSVTVTGAGDEVLTNVVTSDGCVGECTTSHLVGTYSVVKTSDPASGTDVTTGDVVTYTVTVTQDGQGGVAAALSDDLTDVLDDASWNGDLTADGGEAAFDAETGQLVWSGDLAVGDVVTITYSVTVTGGGDHDLTNVVASDGCVGECTTTHPVGSYTVAKTSDPTSGSAVTPGDVITYTVTVTQVGQAGVAAELSDDLSGVLDDATWNDDLIADGGAVAFDGDASLISWSGDLAVGDVVTLTYSVTVTGAGDEVLTNVVTSPGCVGECTTTHSTGTFVFAKSSDPESGTDVEVGETITYTVTVTQQGAGGVTGAVVTDDLSGVLDDASWNDDAAASSGVVERDGETLVWTGDLAVGQVVTITYSVEVTGAGDREIDNVVTSPSPFGSCDPGAVCATDHDVPPPSSASTPPLPDTGADVGLMLGLVALLLAGGFVAVRAGTRRHTV